MDLLATETVSNVLSRLPVKDLMRCKCVCKLWFDFITDPHFISNHYICYNSLEVQQQDHMLLLRHHIFRAKTEISILSWNPNEPKGFVSSQVLKPPHDPYSHGYDIMGPCNGIYFLSYRPLHSPRHCIIMNPSLRQFITLPPSPRHPSTRSCKYPTGFGFDPKTNDYKVVIIRWIQMTITTKSIPSTEIELYSLNSNSWKILEDNPIPFPIARLSGRSLFFSYVNNCCHWWGCLHKSNKEQSDDVECVVLSFDMVSELFRMIKMPELPIITPSSTNRNIIPFSEYATIGIIDYYNVGEGTAECFYFDVWMMKDYWDEGSWIKLYSDCPMPVIYKQLIGYYGSNRYLWIQANKKLVLFGPDSEENTIDLLVCGEFETVVAVRYMESLVSLQRGIRF